MKAIVLSSGGVDSTTCIGIAISKNGKENVSTVSAFYGQKHKKELECAQKIAEYYGIKHYEINLFDILKYSNCPLLANSNKDIIHKSYAEQIKENGISIHTLAWRVTEWYKTNTHLAQDFNPHPRVEGDGVSSAYLPMT